METGEHQAKKPQAAEPFAAVQKNEAEGEAHEGPQGGEQAAPVQAKGASEQAGEPFQGMY